ncbi:hypothetical protein HanPSC8_Chr03g0098791 [Helianthus annuus]|nr:hypothetical protein HanPSC8_Chr03g0098791 [Helianthus annuus]
MVKTKDKAGSSSSKQPQVEEEQPKRRRLTRVGDPDSEEDAPPRGPKPDWTSGSLLDQTHRMEKGFISRTNEQVKVKS